MLDAARECAALARTLAPVTEQRRALPAELVDKLKAQLLRIGLTADLGGAEPTAAEILETAETIATATPPPAGASPSP